MNIEDIIKLKSIVSLNDEELTRDLFRFISNILYFNYYNFTKEELEVIRSEYSEYFDIPNYGFYIKDLDELYIILNKFFEEMYV